MYRLELGTTIDADLEAVWAVWSDMASYPDWDPREEVMRLDGSFAEGTTGFSEQRGRRPGGPIRITRVEPPVRFVVETPLPGGRLLLDHLLETGPDGRTVLTKRYEVDGAMSLAFRLVFARGIRAQMPATFRALAAEVARRSASEG